MVVINRGFHIVECDKVGVERQKKPFEDGSTNSRYSSTAQMLCPYHGKSCCDEAVSTQASKRHCRFNDPRCGCAKRGFAENPCACSLERERKWLYYLWKEFPTRDHQKSCRCCGESRKLGRCSVDGSCECLCVNAGHQVHFFCNATDQNNLAARIAFHRYKIRKSTQWLLINLTVLILCLSDGDFPTILHIAIAIINILNACYYIQNLVRLHVSLVSMKLEKNPNITGNCKWEKNLPSDLTRYIEDASEEFFRRYWQYFSNLLSNLKTVRSSPAGRKETEMGTEADLTALGESMLKMEIQRLNMKTHHAQYRAPFLGRTKERIITAKQLNRYWSKYYVADEDDKVRLSRAQLPFEPNLRGQSSTIDNTNTSFFEKCPEDGSYHEVEISPVLRCSKYQFACESDVHPSPTVAYRSFFEFMKIHHSRDQCSSLTWVANLKFWLSEKIKETVEQFDMANCQLMRLGAGQVRIGSSSVTELQAAFGKNEELSTFTPLLVFLTLTNKQSYLVWRYRMLASQPCLTSYRWDSGGDIRGHWLPETGPSDSNIILHFFCSYMDMRLSGWPYPARARPFSGRYVILADSPLHPLPDMAIVQQWVMPPHFNVAVKGKIYELPGGSNNLLMSLSYLIYCIKIYQRGRIGSVSLGRDGLNILWIVGDAVS